MSSDGSASALFVIEHASRKKGGPPRHLHHNENEWFYVIEGEYIAEVGSERFQLKPGDSLLGPREVPQAWAYVGEGPGKLLIAFSPAGKMEAFFRDNEKRQKEGEYVNQSFLSDRDRVTVTSAVPEGSSSVLLENAICSRKLRTGETKYGEMRLLRLDHHLRREARRKRTLLQPELSKTRSVACDLAATSRRHCPRSGLESPSGTLSEVQRLWTCGCPRQPPGLVHVGSHLMEKCAPTVLPKLWNQEPGSRRSY